MAAFVVVNRSDARWYVVNYGTYKSLLQAMNETFQSLFGSRLKEARKALGLSQEEAANLVSVTREHWGRCERGLAVPGGEVLAALAAAGADVLYILTGQRSQPVSATTDLSPRIRALVDNYEHADEAGKRHIERAADLEAQSNIKKAACGGK